LFGYNRSGSILGQRGKQKKEVVMAQIEKRPHPSGKVTYRVRIRIQGMPDLSATFSTRTAAKEWARKKEAELKDSPYAVTGPCKQAAL
jgi:hypothetical protein